MRTLRLLLVIALAAAVAPAAASAQSPPTGGTPAGTPGSTSPFALSGGGHSLVNRTVRFRGALDAADAGRTVRVESFDPRTGAWVATATATVAADGTFLARWRPEHIGRFQVRAVVARPGTAAAAASPELPLTVYRPAIATWYGPGLYGRRTACGQELTRELVGVAHRRLPCGTNVAVTYRGRTLVVPVVDRGPFAHGADWDLTAAAAQQLGLAETARIGAVRLR